MQQACQLLRFIFVPVSAVLEYAEDACAAGVRRWLSRMWDRSKEGRGQKAPTALPQPPAAAKAADKSVGGAQKPIAHPASAA